MFCLWKAQRHALGSVSFRFHRDISYPVQDHGGLVGEGLGGVPVGDAGEDQYRVDAAFHTGNDIRIHPVPHNDSLIGVAAQQPKAVRIISGFGFPQK